MPEPPAAPVTEHERTFNLIVDAMNSVTDDLRKQFGTETTEDVPTHLADYRFRGRRLAPPVVVTLLGQQNLLNRVEGTDTWRIARPGRHINRQTFGPYIGPVAYDVACHLFPDGPPPAASADDGAEPGPVDGPPVTIRASASVPGAVSNGTDAHTATTQVLTPATTNGGPPPPRRIPLCAIPEHTNLQDLAGRLMTDNAALTTERDRLAHENAALLRYVQDLEARMRAAGQLLNLPSGTE